MLNKVCLELLSYLKSDTGKILARQVLVAGTEMLPPTQLIRSI